MNHPLRIEPLGYRPWKGRLWGPALRFWPIARRGMLLVLKKKVFWVFLFISLFSFLFHSAMIYLLAQVEGRLGAKVPAQIREVFPFTGTGEAYRNFIFFQGTVVMLMLALASGLLVGNDFRSSALAFYLSKPIGKIDYFLGKFAAAAGLTAMITLVPALVLYIEYGAFTESFAYYRDNLRILGAIAAYGALVSAVSGVLLLGLAALLKRTIPIVLAWGGLFVFLPGVANLIREVHRSHGFADPWAWSLFDIWANLRWVSNALFGIRDEVYSLRWPAAAAVILAACSLSVLVFWKRVSAAEVVK